MKTLIYSHFFRRPGHAGYRGAMLPGVLDLWYDHLRGPGCYTGDVLLFTNVEGLRRPGLMTRPMSHVPVDSHEGYLQRVLTHHDVPVRNYDVVMQMDMDILAIADVAPLFPTDERLWAAPSDLRTLDGKNAWTLIPRWRRVLHKVSGWRMREPGVSACVIACASAAWERHLSAWARAIQAHGNRPLPPLLDQSFLNLLWLKGTVPMACWPPELICHRDWDTAGGARLLHFPGRRKQEMQRFRVV